MTKPQKHFRTFAAKIEEKIGELGLEPESVLHSMRRARSILRRPIDAVTVARIMLVCMDTGAEFDKMLFGAYKGVQLVPDFGDVDEVVELIGLRDHSTPEHYLTEHDVIAANAA